MSRTLARNNAKLSLKSLFHNDYKQPNFQKTILFCGPRYDIQCVRDDFKLNNCDCKSQQRVKDTQPQVNLLAFQVIVITVS